MHDPHALLRCSVEEINYGDSVLYTMYNRAAV